MTDHLMLRQLLRDWQINPSPLEKDGSKKKRGNVIVMYEIPGVSNGQKTAHITVYFGSEEHAAAY